MIVWAKSNGNWSTASLWAFWNETTQQIEDYGQVPQVDDVVYCNGYDVTIDTDYIKVEAIRNGLVIHTNRIGGKFITRVSHTYQLECNIYSDVTNDYILTFRGCTYNETYTQVIIGNVQSVQGAYSLLCTDARYIISINGNTNGQVYYAGSGAGSKTFNLTINGNVVANVIGVSPNWTSSPPINLTVNGNVDLSGNLVEYGRNLNYHQVGKLSLIGQNSSLNVTQYTGFTAYTITLDGILSIKDKSLYEIFNTNDLSLKTTTGMSIETEYDYPQQSDVKKDVTYAYGQMVGAYDINQFLPPESVVLKDYEYGDEDDPKTGTMVQEVNVEVGCVTPEDVRKDVPLVGMGVVGSLVVPSVDDVRERVIFDNGSVGTLIVQGGGDRLRIADFGYYTNAQSDTYIVDLTEQDKPKFAVAEERVLIEMFPDLDLANIPEKYFDDLFVKYLKYRLIVEYYRTAGINSTFTPSEPTTEIVNYQNVRNEVWLNSANIYLKAWAKKYPESITKPQRILL